MNKMLQTASRALEMARVYPSSLYGGLKNRRSFKDIRTYCTFIGYPKSGHSLVGALLDAHPNMVIAHELDTLKFASLRFNKKQIYHLLLENSRAFAETGRKWNSYSYEVDNQWQGRFKQLLVIGDKKGGNTTFRLRAWPWLLQRLRSTIDADVKFIHVVRNPYDNIRSTCFKINRDTPSLDLRQSTEYYFSLCEAVADIKKRIKGDDLFELRHERFIDDPKTCLKEICRFLGVEAPGDYLSDCARIVFKSPRRCRYDVKWSRELLDIVKDRIEDFPFLQGYSYEN